MLRLATIPAVNIGPLVGRPPDLRNPKYPVRVNPNTVMGLQTRTLMQDDFDFGTGDPYPDVSDDYGPGNYGDIETLTPPASSPLTGVLSSLGTAATNAAVKAAANAAGIKPTTTAKPSLLSGLTGSKLPSWVLPVGIAAVLFLVLRKK